jgi:hypothetical protein
MGGVQKINPINFVQLVVVKNLNVLVMQQVQVDLVAIVPNSHHKSPLHIQKLDFFMQGKISEFLSTHSLNSVSSFSAAIYPKADQYPVCITLSKMDLALTVSPCANRKLPTP